MSESSQSALERAVIAMLRPVVRLVLKRGLAYGRFTELLKRAYVDAAVEDFTVPGRKLSISRVAVLTGLTRKEASRLMQTEADASTEITRRQVNRAARVVSAWVTEAAYQDEEGRPAVLPFEAESGASFTALVSAHGGDVGPRAVLDELLRVGAVDRADDDRLRLLERAYVPATDEAAKLDILGTDVGDLVAAIDHNLDPERGAPFFQRKVAYDHLPAEYLPALRALLAERGQALLEELNDDMRQHDGDVDGEAAPAGERHRAMVGIYYYEEPQDED